jgi:DNA helicase-2/ATP-dependent DNA helicase PcrA
LSKTAPLVSLCIKLIARGIAATVKGRAIGEQIKGDLQEIGKMPGFRYENFNDAVNAYRMAKIQRYQGLDNEEQLISCTFSCVVLGDHHCFIAR